VVFEKFLRRGPVLDRQSRRRDPRRGEELSGIPKKTQRSSACGDESATVIISSHRPSSLSRPSSSTCNKNQYLFLHPSSTSRPSLSLDSADLRSSHHSKRANNQEANLSVLHLPPHSLHSTGTRRILPLFLTSFHTPLLILQLGYATPSPRPQAIATAYHSTLQFPSPANPGTRGPSRVCAVNTDKAHAIQCLHGNQHQ
jgi:hypothetical protein